MDLIEKILDLVEKKDVDKIDFILKFFDILGMPVVGLYRDRIVAKKYNNSFLKLCGCEETEIENIVLSDLVLPEHREIALKHFEIGYDKAYRIKVKNLRGEEFLLSLLGKNIVHNGEEVRLVIYRDLTTNAKLKEENFLLREAIDVLRESIVMTDVDGNIIFVNKFFEEITGYNKDEAIGQNPRILKSDYHSREFYEELWNTILSGKTWQGEFLNKRKDGTLYWERAVISPVKDEEGNIRYFISGKQDITKEKRLLEENLTTQKLYESLVKHAPLAILTFNIKGQIEVVNQKMLDFLGSPSEEATKEINMLTFEPLKKIGVVTKFKEAIGLKKQITFKGEYISKWGKKIFYKLYITPLMNNDNKVERVVVFAEDISKERKYEQAIIEAKEKAERNDKLKNLFLANVSHELRTPLNAVIGFSDLMMQDEALSDEHKEYMKIINNSGNHLLRLIDDLMSITKIEADEVKIQYEKVRLGDFINDFTQYYSEYKSTIYGKEHIVFMVEGKKKYEDLEIVIDKTRLKQILTNLLDNAFKFTEEGSVTFGYTVENEKEVIFYVKDTGIGIPYKKRDLIFQKFRQGEDGLNRKYEGSGLGLYIVKRLTELMNGKVYFESEVGHGTVFYVSFPMNNNKKKDLHSQEFQVSVEINLLQNYKILVVEDDPVNKKLIERYLGCDGINCFLVTNGKEAIDLVEKEKDFDVALVDIRIPEIDGIEVAAYIKRKYPRTRVVMQTAHAFEEEMKKAREVGCDGYITKPFTKEQLIDEIKRVTKGL